MSRVPGVKSEFAVVEQAVRDIASGKPVVVVDDEDRENEGDLIFAAEHATTSLMSFMVRHTSGYICVALAEEEADRLDLPPMVARNEDKHGTAYAISVDARQGVSTGISAADRAHTARLLADAHTTAHDLTRPGHVVPLRAREGGVLKRRGHTEAAVDLAVLAGLRPAGVLCEIVSEQQPTEMARTPELRRFAHRHGLTLVSIADLIAYRRVNELSVQRVVSARMPLRAGNFTAVGFTSNDQTGEEHIALICGDLRGAEHVPVHIHSECIFGDVFGARQCGCAGYLDSALSEISASGRGVVLYLRNGEYGGHGLWDAVRVRSTPHGHRADPSCGAPLDEALIARILLDLGLRNPLLITRTDLQNRRRQISQHLV
ncbi:3,4-dihydroxy-2-butanone-4-phosphate synthase [Rhodococcus sp. 14C212]|nr:3,4-dihydroxy-2-butanone-4-phosphate synthase [Rhodococcus sp. 14C212]NGP07380.1 3,4-dihydroxy-2-butanone-4-phosphate synthase [Rhodococcus sp. 14C212]